LGHVVHLLFSILDALCLNVFFQIAPNQLQKGLSGFLEKAAVMLVFYAKIKQHR